MDLLSHPFRLDPNGSVATVVDGTLDALAEEVAVHALTVRGERDLAPDFGVTDPTFAGFDVDELATNLTDFDVPATVSLVSITHPTATTERIELALEEDTDAVS